MCALTAYVRAFALAACMVSTTEGARYHFSSIDGNDSRSPIDVGNEATPWRSLSKLKSVTLLPGDQILLRGGSLWREQLEIKGPGTAALPIVVTAYGLSSGTPLPEIRGTDTIKALSRGSHWAARVTSKASVSAMFVRGTFIPVSRYPIDSGWLIATSVGDSGISSPDFVGEDWKGGTAHIRTVQWYLESHDIKSSANGSIEFPTKITYKIPNSRFYVTNANKAFFASHVGWQQYAGNDSIRWKSNLGSNISPVEVAVRSYGIFVDSSNHVHISNIKVFGTSSAGVFISSGKGIILSDLIAEHPGIYGFMVNGRNCKVMNSTVTAASGNAIDMHGTGHTIYRNTVRNTALARILGPRGTGRGCCNGNGIETTSDSAVIRGNTVDSSGLTAITFKGLASKVDSNIVSHSCATLDDCGSIHTWSGKYPVVGSAFSVIRHNIVRDAIGNSSGLSSYYPAYQGIYLDDGSHDIRVDSNIVYGNYSGIFLHNTQNIQVRGNIIYSNNSSQIRLEHDSLAGNVNMFGNTILENLIVSQNSQKDTLFVRNLTQTPPYASWLSNTFCHETKASVYCQMDGKTLLNNIRDLNTELSLGSETQTATFQSVASGSIGANQSGVWLDSGAACGSGTCLRIDYSTANVTRAPSISNYNTFQVTAGTKWLLSLRVRGKKNVDFLVPTLRQSYGSFQALANNLKIPLDTAWVKLSLQFDITKSDSAARLDFFSNDGNTLYWIDDISLKQILPTPGDTISSSRILITTPTQKIPANLPNLGTQYWVDRKGSRVSSYSLPEFRGTVVFPVKRMVIMPGLARSTSVSETPRLAFNTYRSGNLLHFEGLESSGILFTAQGKHLGTVVPDPTGRASVPFPETRTPVFFRTHDRTMVLFPSRR